MQLTHLVMFKFWTGASPTAASGPFPSTYTGVGVLLVPAATMSAEGLWLGYQSTPFIRRVNQASAPIRRRVHDTQSIEARRLSDEHQDETKTRNTVEKDDSAPATDFDVLPNQ